LQANCHLVVPRIISPLLTGSLAHNLQAQYPPPGPPQLQAGPVCDAASSGSRL
jgi:hypothetical protein